MVEEQNSNGFASEFINDDNKDTFFVWMSTSLIR